MGWTVKKGESFVVPNPGDDNFLLPFINSAVCLTEMLKTIGKHINNVFNEGELVKEVVVAKFATTTQHGAIKGKTQTTKTEHYNLDVIISVGYKEATVAKKCNSSNRS